MPLSSLSVVVRVLPVPVGPTHNTWTKREGRGGEGGEGGEGGKGREGVRKGRSEEGKE